MSKARGKELKSSTYRIYENDFKDKIDEYAVINYIEELSGKKGLSVNITKWIIEGALRDLDVKEKNDEVDNEQMEFDYDELSKKIVEEMMERKIFFDKMSNNEMKEVKEGVEENNINDDENNSKREDFKNKYKMLG